LIEREQVAKICDDENRMFSVGKDNTRNRHVCDELCRANLGCRCGPIQGSFLDNLESSLIKLSVKLSEFLYLTESRERCGIPNGCDKRWCIFEDQGFIPVEWTPFEAVAVVYKSISLLGTVVNVEPCRADGEVNQAACEGLDLIFVRG
jgi:hypothetical protein